jgi:hypothetical protein
MKKLRFKELCQDKNTGTYYRKGDVVEFEDARAFEIMQHNVAEVIETRVESEPFVEKEQEVDETEQEVEEMEATEEAEQEVEETKEEKPKRGRKPKAEQDK